jgi:signal transduction histidine kinase/ActR/RegA family two-component response regulator/HPt (histidine-containing phosphotransfer) domain-containing protein
MPFVATFRKVAVMVRRRVAQQWPIDGPAKESSEERLRGQLDFVETAMHLCSSSLWEWGLREDQRVASAFPLTRMMPSRSAIAEPSPASADFLSVLGQSGVPPEDVKTLVMAIQGCIDGRTPDFRIEYRSRPREGGAEQWRLARGDVRRGPQGTPISFRGGSTDITELKRTEEASRQLATTLSRAEVALWDLDLRSGSITHSRVDGKVYSSLLEREIAPGDRARVNAAVQACARGETDELHIEFRGVDNGTGRVHSRLARGSVVRDSDGAPLRIVGISLDVTSLKHAEEEARRTTELLEVARHLSMVYVWSFELEDGEMLGARATFINVWESLGYDPAVQPTDFGAAMGMVVVREDQDVVMQAMLGCIRGDTPAFEQEFRIQHADGSIHWNLGRGIAVRNADGRPVRFVGTSVDITDMKRIEAETHRARETAESANRAKDEFLANVSHEIRTPLNAIIGMTELALEGAQTPHQRQILSTVKSAGTNLLGIVNDLLDFSKITAGKLTLEERAFSLRDAVGDTLRALSIRAHRKGLELIGHVHDDAPDALRGDAGRLRQVLQNLVDNAIKFTVSGKVVVDVMAAAETTPLGTHDVVSLAFVVRDTGIGIAREKHASIFSAFEQGDATTTRKYGGTGLGLTISAQLVALMGGAITVDSEPGRGSTFTFTARFASASDADLHRIPSPTALADRPAMSAYPAPEAHPLRILVAEDNEFNVALLEELLGQRGHHARFAADGRAALALATEEAFDLVLLDLYMPEMDGFEVVRAIRDRERGTSAHLPIVALTARSSRGDRERALAAGMDGFLSKPIEVGALWSTLDGLTAPPSARRGSTLLDSHAILRASGGRPEALESLRGLFRETLPAQLASARSAMDQVDLARLRDASHLLHGTLSAFSPIVGFLARALEDAAARDDGHTCSDLLGQLEAMCADLLEEMRTVDAHRLSSAV